MRARPRMTRCECQEVPFRRVLNFAREYESWDFDSLCNRVGCGQVCTACHCDLKRYLDENQSRTSWLGFLPQLGRDLYDLPALPQPDLASALSPVFA